MDIGWGIFLGLVFCGCAYIYSRFPERLNIKKIFLVIIKIIFLIGVLIGLFYLYGLLSDWNDNRPTEIEKIDNIKIGTSFSDIKFSIDTLKKDEENSKKYIEDYKEKNDGFYDFNDRRNSVEIINSKVTRIIHWCDQDSYDSTSINGINCNDSSEQILEKFGENTLILCAISESENEEEINSRIRIYEVEKYKIAYHLYLNKVIGFAAFDKEKKKKSKNYKKCSIN